MASDRINPSGMARNPACAFYRWETEGEPVAVHFHLNVVEVLEREIARAGDIEIAGLLLGRFNQSSKPTFIIEDCDPTPFMTHHELSDPTFAKLVLEAMAARWHSMPEKRLSVLGFYRASATGSSKSSPRDASWSLIGADSERIHLVIEPRPRRAPEATLSLVDNGTLTWSWHPIPFSRPELCGVGTTPTTDVFEDESFPASVQHAEGFASVTTENVEDGGTFTSDQNNSPSDPYAEKSKSRGKVNLSRKVFVGLGLLFVCAALALGIGMRSSRGSQQFRTVIEPAQKPNNPSPLGLRVQREGKDWRVNWDRNAPVLSGAKRARLSITDGIFHKTMDLNPTDLHSGIVTYTPVSDDVVLRMEIFNEDSAAEVSESVRIVSGPTFAPTDDSANRTVPITSDQSVLRMHGRNAK